MIKVSVRDLVEFILRSGDLDNRFRGTIRAVEGTRAHQLVQEEYIKKAAFSGEEYTPEVFLKYSLEKEGMKFQISGRADGLIREKNKIIIDEIKSTTDPVNIINEGHRLHWAQAKCYAFFYAEQNQLDKIGIQLTYFQINTEEVKRIRKDFNLKELRNFFNDLIFKYINWARLEKEWKIKRDASIRELSFPYSNYRKGQRKLAVAVYKTIVEEKNLYAQAPTGTGKTISTLFPAIKAVGEGQTSKIFYLTAKNTSARTAEEAISIMEEKGLQLKALTLTAKEKICFQHETNCHPDYCESARGHYDRINGALKDIIHNNNQLSRDVIEKYGREYQVCPFELSLDLISFADCIIGDYNYIFDPVVNLKGFMVDNDGEYTLLIDEAHNLVDRSRDMFSGELTIKPFQELKGNLQDNEQPEIIKPIVKIIDYISDLGRSIKDSDFSILEEEPRELYLILNELISQLERWLVNNSEQVEGYDELLELYFDILAFLRISEFYDESYTIYVQKKFNNIRIKLFCRDSSYLLGNIIKKGKSAVFFSATLTPLDYFREMLGGNDNDYVLSLPSPFARERLALLVADDFSTRYRDRPDSYALIADYIDRLVKQKQGNYLVFFPSYEYLDEVLGSFGSRYPDIRTLVQSSKMTERERRNFLDNFQSGGTETLLAFAVLGGIFAEGIDLKGDRLLGTIIVGVGHPQICLERDLIRNYFQEKNRRGYEYAYLYPGMNKVFQAAGRTIRSERDRGVIMLIGERFTNYNYHRLFPANWNSYQRVNKITDIETYLEHFWMEEID